MSQTRIYVPLTPQQCRVLVKARRVDGVPREAHAVTRALAVTHPGAGLEVHEHLALQAAAEAALDAASGSGDRVVVAAADVDAEVVEDGAGQNAEPSLVVLTEPLALQRISSLHVGDPVEAATSGQADAEIELSWYDVTELPVVLDLL